MIAIVTVGQSWSLVMHEMKISQNTLKSGTFGAGLQALVDTLLCYEGLSVHANWSNLLLWYRPCVLVMYKVTIPLPISQRCARTFPPEVVLKLILKTCGRRSYGKEICDWVVDNEVMVCVWLNLALWVRLSCKIGLTGRLAHCQLAFGQLTWLIVCKEDFRLRWIIR